MTAEKSLINYVPKAFNTDVVNDQEAMKKVCICVPTTGLIRVEWMMARFGAVIPVNWSNGDMYYFYDQFSPRDM